MKNKKSTKYRLILTLSDQDIAFARLYNELKKIEHKYSGSENINNEKRKLFLRILLAYCNPHTSDASNAYTIVPARAAVIDPPPILAPTPPPTPPPDTHEVTPSTGLKKPDGRIHFGDLKIDID